MSPRFAAFYARAQIRSSHPITRLILGHPKRRRNSNCCSHRPVAGSVTAHSAVATRVYLVKISFMPELEHRLSACAPSGHFVHWSVAGRVSNPPGTQAACLCSASTSVCRYLVKISFTPAMRRTVARKREITRTSRRRLPKCEPIMPPIIAAAARTSPSEEME